MGRQSWSNKENTLLVRRRRRLHVREFQFRGLLTLNMTIFAGILRYQHSQVNVQPRVATLACKSQAIVNVLQEMEHEFLQNLVALICQSNRVGCKYQL